jgi:signal transduction histidine kinase
LVTGLSLPPQFRQIRIKLTAFVFVFLSLLLVLSGFNVYETTRLGLENFRNQVNNQANNQLDIILQRQNNQDLNISGPRPRLIGREVAEDSRLETLVRIQTTVIINNSGLVILLTVITWLSLFLLLRPLAKATQAREEFLIQASHELRTPLAILHSELSLSANENNIQNLKQTHQEALQEIKRLQHLSSTLLGRAPEEYETILVDKVIQQAWENLSKFNVKNLSLNLNTTGKTIIKSNSTKFYQLIFNILENAVKHSKANSDLNIELTSSQITISNLTEFNTYKEGVGIMVANNLVKDLDLKINSTINNGTFITILNLA